MANIEDLKKDLKKIQDKLKKTEKDSIKEIDKAIKPLVRQRWLDGMGVENHGDDAKSLKSLAKSTVESRKYKKKKGKLSPLTDTDKSNLIDTGKTFKQFKSKISKNNLEIGVIGDRDKIIEYTVKDRPLLNLSSDEVEKIDEIVNKEIDKLFKDL